MEKILCSFVQNNFLYSSKKLSANVNFDVESSIVKFLQKIIFKQDVLSEWKKILTLVSSPEEFSIRNETVKKTVQVLLDLLSSGSDQKLTVDCFRCVFRAFASSCKKEESSIVMQFFSFLSYILGINNQLKIDANENVQNIPVVNDKTFKAAFAADVSSFDTTSALILKELLSLLSRQSFNLESPEMQPHSRWLQTLIKNLARSNKEESVFMEIFSESIDIGLKLVEINFDEIFLNVFQRDKPPNKNFQESYYKFLEKMLKTSAKYQRLVKFIARFLSLSKLIQKNATSNELLPANVIGEYSKILTVMSSQQLSALIKVLIQQLEENCKDISQNKNASGTLVFEVTTTLLISFLREVKIYAPSTSHATFQSFVNDLNHLKEILRNFGTFVLSETNFILKHEKLLEFYLELCFYYTEVEALIFCFKDAFSQSSLSVADDWGNSLFDWDSSIENYFNENSSKCRPLFFKMAFQRIRISKLKNVDSPPSQSTMKIFGALFESKVEEIDIFHHLPGEDLILLLEASTAKQRKMMMKKLINRFLIHEEETDLTKWMSNEIILENRTFTLGFFVGLIRKVNLIWKKILFKKNGDVLGLSDEFFDDLENSPVVEKMEKLPDRMNSMLKESKKIFEKTTENPANPLRKIVRLFNSLPLIHMEGNLKMLGLGFAVELAVFSFHDESLIRISLEKLDEFLSGFEMDLNKCFDFGIFLNWLMEIDSGRNRTEMNELKKRLVEKLIEICSRNRLGIDRIENLIDSRRFSNDSNSVEDLETGVAIYQELGRCLNRGRKRKSDDGAIENCRRKLAKVISEEFMEIDEGISLGEDNYKLLFKMFRIELEKAGKEEIYKFSSKFPVYFDFAVSKLKTGYDESCCLFLLTTIEMADKMREFDTEKDRFYKIWSAVKIYKLSDWKIFATNSTDSEFDEILNDLLVTTKEFLSSPSSLDKSHNYFEIWRCFLESDSPQEKRNKCQIQLQKLFRHVRDGREILIGKASPIEKKIWLAKFFCYCLSSKKLVLTHPMLDAILEVTLHCRDESESMAMEEFHDLFTNQVEGATHLFPNQFVWNKNKIHLSYFLFERFLNDLVRRSDEASTKMIREDISLLSACAFSMEKWINLMSKMKKDLARIAPYFIASIISCITTVTILPAIKIHLVNCLNGFLSMSDSHTISYLLRVLKPGHQQVFTSLYDQFKKFHKYSGKI